MFLHVAVDRQFQKDGEREADFINIVVWRNTAEFLSKYFSKGKPIAHIQSKQENTKTKRATIAQLLKSSLTRFILCHRIKKHKA